MGETTNLPRSKGFEGIAVTPDGRRLYPMLEGPLTTDPDQQRLIINEFSLKSRRSRDGSGSRLEARDQAIGDFTALTDRTFLVIERDNLDSGGRDVQERLRLRSR